MPSPPPCLSPLAEHLRASLPWPALAWPCGPLTCTGKCQLCGVSLKSGLSPRLPYQGRRSNRVGSPDANGYIRVFTPFARVHLHRLVYEVATGLPIPPGYHIHHLDGNVAHNCPGNLQALPASVHGFIGQQRHPLVSLCLHCGRPFRTRRESNQIPPLTRHCSRRCSTRHRAGWPPPPPCCPYEFFLQSMPLTCNPLTPCLTYDQPSLFPH